MRGFDDDELIHRINVTPLVDVVLVLLVVLMVAATAALSQIPVQLPVEGTSSGTPPISVSIEPSGVRLDRKPMTKPELRAHLRSTRPTSAVVAAAGTVDHASIMEIMDLLRREGVQTIAMKTDADDAD